MALKERRGRREIKMSTTRLAAAVAAAVFVAGVSTSVTAQEEQTFAVDCSLGQTITKGLERGDVRKPLVLIVRGTCNENVRITRDHVTLQGDPPRVATVRAANPNAHTITVMATWVRIDGLTVTGGLNGIWTTGVPHLAVANSVIQNAAQNGISLGASAGRLVGNTIQNNGNDGLLLRSAQAFVMNSQIQHNSSAGIRISGHSSLETSATNISFNGGVGVLSERGSSVSMQSDSISSNGFSGVELYTGSQAVISNATITANGTNPSGFRHGVMINFSNARVESSQITNNPGIGVAVVGYGDLPGNTITGNGDHGISVYGGSVANVVGGTVSGNNGTGVMVIGNSTVQILGATIVNNARHGIELLFGSKLLLWAPNSTVGANAWYGLWCNDGESSVNDTSVLVFSPPNGGGGSFCTGY